MPETEPRRVLVVDDDPLIRDLLRACLEADGYAVRELPCGRDIVRVVRTWEPDVVLLDVMMQPVNGFQVMQELRAAGLVPGVPVLFLTALEAADRRALARQTRGLGARAWVQKPADWSILKGLIDHPPAPWAAPWAAGDAEESE